MINKLFFLIVMLISIQSLIITHSAQVTDIDGNVYDTVTIGVRTWMVENLRTTKYNDGTAIPKVTERTAWGSLNTHAYCWYNNDSTMYSDPYGALYNWYTINTGKLCPTGWHVAIMTEFIILDKYLESIGYDIAFDYANDKTLRSTALSLCATTNWNESSLSGAPGNSDFSTYRNKTGFTALPGGLRDADGYFKEVGKEGHWWSSSDVPSGFPFGWNLLYNNPFIIWSNSHKQSGQSIRCVKD